MKVPTRSLDAAGARGAARPVDARHLVTLLAVAAVYFAAARLGLSFAFATKQVTAVWPPAGIAFVAYVLFGYRMWPGVFLGALLANATADEAFSTAMGIAAGNTLQGLVGVALLRRFAVFDGSLARLKDFLGLALFGAALGCLVSATGGVLNLALAGTVPWSGYGSVWWVWWVGDAQGVLLTAPLLLTWIAQPRLPWRGRRLAELAALFAGLAIVCHVALSGTVVRTGSLFRLEYAVFPFCIWSALRFGQRETASAVLLVAGAAIWGAIHDRGPFATGTQDQRLVLLDAFTAVVAVTGLTLGAVTAERRSAERNLQQAHDELDRRVRERTAELATAQEVAHLGSWEWDLGTDQFSGSDELCRILGMTTRDFPRTFTGYLDRVHPDDRAAHQATLERHRLSPETYECECRIVRPNGDVRTLRTRGRVSFDQRGAPARMNGVVEDTTERKAMQERLVLSERMASVGTLAAGVAHEINNPLTYVTGNIHLMEEELAVLRATSPSASLDELQVLLAEAGEGAERVRKIVRGLMAFSSADRQVRTVLEVTTVLDASAKMAQNEIRHRARLVKDYGEVPPVEADEVQLAQVFINLLVNAAQAIPAGNAESNEIRLTTRTSASGAAVIEVRDTGPGIPSGVLGRIFDPFFTTKEIGEGTGLGLSICHGIVTALGGEIGVESEVGKGTLFRVTLPAAQGGPVVGVAPKPEAPAPGRRGRVLVVDDDPTVGKSVGRMLQDEHEVSVVTTGAEALAALRSGPPFDAILCDLMMPVMTGMELHAQIGAWSPELQARMIFLTGGAFSPTARQFLEAVPNPRFEKPFDIGEVRAAVQALMLRKAGGATLRV